MIRKLTQTAIILLLCLACTAREKPLAELTVLLDNSKRDTNRIDILYQLATHYTSKEEMQPSDIDSAFYFANQALALCKSYHQLRFEGKCWYLFSQVYRARQDIPKGKDCIQKAISLLSEHGTRKELAESYWELSQYYDRFNAKEVPERMDASNRAAQLYAQAGDMQNYADALLDEVDVYTGAGGVPHTADTIQKAIRIYEQFRLPDIQYVYDHASVKYRGMANFPMAFKYGILAVKAIEAAKDSSIMACEAYQHLGLLYYSSDKPDEGQDNCKKALYIAVRFKDPIAYDIGRIIIQDYNKRGDLEKASAMIRFIEQNFPAATKEDRLPIAGVAYVCYTKLKDFNLANQYRTTLLEYFNAHPPLFHDQIKVYGSLIQGLLLSGQYSQAYKYCRHYEEFNKYYGFAKDLAATYRWMFRCDSAQGHFADALKHYRMSTAITDSLDDAAKTEQISELQLQYETEKKEQDIALLSKQSQLQTSELQQSTLVRNITLGGAAALLLIIGLGYNRYRLKQHSNRMLEARQKEINQKNDSLRQLVEEKEWLIKEIHHRVKNNLQIVMSLLSSQSMYLDNDAAVKAIRASQHRMQAMSLIHQKLYQSDNVASVDMKTYISELVDYLRESMDTAGRVIFVQDVDPLRMDAAQAIPVGLILNETITNALKYAFPPDSRGQVTLTLKKKDGDKIYLAIRDNGAGLDEATYENKKGSLGMSLVQGLANQLGGDFSLRNDRGLIIEIGFPYFTSSEIAKMPSVLP